MKTTEMLAKLNKKYPTAQFTVFANGGQWDAAQDAAGRYGLRGVWMQIAEARGLPCDDSAWDQWLAGRRGKESSVSAAAATLGRKGGAVKSEAKSEAARENGRKGGRPKKSDYLPVWTKENPERPGFITTVEDFLAATKPKE
jgi:hypothetical protein